MRMRPLSQLLQPLHAGDPSYLSFSRSSISRVGGIVRDLIRLRASLLNEQTMTDDEMSAIAQNRSRRHLKNSSADTRCWPRSAASPEKIQTGAKEAKRDVEYVTCGKLEGDIHTSYRESGKALCSSTGAHARIIGEASNRDTAVWRSLVSIHCGPPYHFLRDYAL